MKNGILFLFILLILGCEENKKLEIVYGIANDIRITSVVVETKTENNAVSGAIVGGILAGTAGAIIGSAVGSDDNKVFVQNKILGCSFEVKFDNNVSVLFVVVNDNYAPNTAATIKCSLLRSGDQVSLGKTTYLRNGSEFYYWEHLAGEIKK